MSGLLRRAGLILAHGGRGDRPRLLRPLPQAVVILIVSWSVAGRQCIDETGVTSAVRVVQHRS